MRALVTGHAGFIGSHIADELVGMGITVIGVDVLGTAHFSSDIDHSGPQIHDWPVDITNFDELAQLFKTTRPDYVFHNAAAKKVDCQDDPQRNFDVNATGTLNLLELSLEFGVKRFIHASTGSVYGQPTQFPVTENHPTRPISPYGAAKLVAESYCQFYQMLGLDTVILRYFHVYGPRQRCGDNDGGVVGIFCRRWAQSLPLIVHGDGEQVRCFTYVGDIVKANIVAAFHPETNGKIFNVCSSERTSINQLAVMLGCHVSKCNIEIGEPRSYDVRDWHVSHQRIACILGMDNWTRLEVGLRKAQAWYGEQYIEARTE